MRIRQILKSSQFSAARLRMRRFTIQNISLEFSKSTFFAICILPAYVLPRPSTIQNLREFIPIVASCIDIQYFIWEGKICLSKKHPIIKDKYHRNRIHMSSGQILILNLWLLFDDALIS